MALRRGKNKNGNYWVDFYINGKKYIRSTRTSDRRTAERIHKKIQGDIVKRIFKIEDISPAKSKDLDEFTKEYLEYSQNHKARKTYLWDELTLRNFAKFLDRKNIESINSRIIDQYLNSRVKEVKKSTVNIEFRHLKAAFSKAVQWDYIEKNPFIGIRQFSIPKGTPLYLSEEEIRILLDRIEEQWLKEIVEFAVNTGVRIGELVNIEWRDIDFNNNLVRISQKKDFTTKSKKERSIALHDDVFTMLVGMRRKGGYVFSYPNGQKRDPNSVSKCFKGYVRKIGLDERYTFHTLRHTFASHLVQKGVSLYIVSKLLGHSDIKTTQIYSHLAPQTFHDAINVLDFRGNKNLNLSVISGGRNK